MNLRWIVEGGALEAHAAVGHAGLPILMPTDGRAGRSCNTADPRTPSGCNDSESWPSRQALTADYFGGMCGYEKEQGCARSKNRLF